MPVPNVPCGVESLFGVPASAPTGQFLMHRVELKVQSKTLSGSFFLHVPNAPCGVESCYSYNKPYGKALVPNAPCGVESGLPESDCIYGGWFLMHRVELKGA